MNKIVREIKLTKILGDDKLSSDVRKIKDFFEDVFNGLEQEVLEDKPHLLYFYKMDDSKKSNYFIEDSKMKILYCSYQDIWTFFRKEFNYQFEQINEISHAMLEMHLNRKVSPTWSWL